MRAIEFELSMLAGVEVIVLSERQESFLDRELSLRIERDNADNRRIP